MRPYLFVLLIFSFAYCSSNSGENKISSESGRETKPLNLELKVNGLPNTYLKLIGYFGENQYLVDSALTDANGKALFKRDTLLPGGMYFVIGTGMNYIQLLLDKNQHVTMEFDKSNPTLSMKVTNSLDNELLYKNLKFEAGINPKFDAVQKKISALTKGTAEYDAAKKEQEKLVAERKEHIKWFADNHPESFFTKFKIAGQNPELKTPTLPGGEINVPLQTYYFINDYWKGYDFSDERLLHTPVYFNKLKKFVKDYIPQGADSLIKYCDPIIMASKANSQMFKFTVNWIALQYKEPKVMGQDAFYVHLIEKYWTVDQAFWSKEYEIDRLRAQARQMKPSLIGMPGQNVTGTNESGQQVSIEDIKTPVIVVYIFSYDCENCQKETPKLLNVYNQWKDKGMGLFTIGIDGDRDKWKAYLQKNGMAKYNIFDPENKTNFRLKYHVDVTPEIYVLDKDRKIIASNIGSEALKEILAEELSK